MKSVLHRLKWIGIGFVWFSVCAFGLLILLDYSTTPNLLGSLPLRWPSGSKIPLAKSKPTLIMLTHPKCPCTRASIGELAWIMARAQDKVAAYVLLVKPENLSDRWERTDIEETAASIPGVKVLSDENGTEAQRFGAATSGQTLVYDATGLLKFRGGITTSRGHTGDNAGRESVLSLLTSGTAIQSESPVFGCSLLTAHWYQRRSKWKMLNWIQIRTL